MTYFMKTPALPLSHPLRSRLFGLGILAVLCFLGSSLMAQQSYHHLIAGSFDDFASANEMMASLRTKGDNPALIFPSKTSERYRVSVFQSANREEVETYQKNLKRKGRGKNFWILSYAPEGDQAQVTNMRTAQKESMPNDGSGNTYHLIVGSFDNLTAADRSVLALEEQGYEPYVLVPGGEMDKYRVSVYRSMDREEIETYGKLLRKRGKKDGWIYEEEEGTITNFSQVGTAESNNARLEPGEKKATATPSDQTFHLIAGSFASFDQASDFADLMRTKGYNPFIMFPEDGNGQSWRVSVYQSTMRGRVETFKQKLGKQGTNGWILAQ
jgi:cell division septation protein DedD